MVPRNVLKRGMPWIFLLSVASKTDCLLLFSDYDYEHRRAYPELVEGLGMNTILLQNELVLLMGHRRLTPTTVSG